jgi:hypothetical protein
MPLSRRVRCLTHVQHCGLQTKELLADLQDLLPNTEDAGGANLTMNTVLQCAIDFLTQHAGRWTVTTHVISLRLPVPARNLSSPRPSARDSCRVTLSRLAIFLALFRCHLAYCLQ